jgi:hypothetical protein
VLDRRGQTESERHLLYDWGPIEEAIKTDRHISRRHALVSSVGMAVIEITDLNSLNGTVVEVVEPKITD